MLAVAFHMSAIIATALSQSSIYSSLHSLKLLVLQRPLCLYFFSLATSLLLSHCHWVFSLLVLMGDFGPQNSKKLRRT